MMYRALILASLVTIHQKHLLVVYRPLWRCVQLGSGAALTYMKGGTLEQIENTITNTLANIAGIVCDGLRLHAQLKLPQV